MKKLIGTFLLMLATSAIKGMQAPTHLELTRLKMSLMYLRFIKTFRLLFFSVLGMAASMIFLLAGLILFHVSLFVYAPWSMIVKLWVGLAFSVAYLTVTLVIFYQIFSSNHWSKIFHADNIIKYLHKEGALKDHAHSRE